jgi:hypothetical protein
VTAGVPAKTTPITPSTKNVISKEGFNVVGTTSDVEVHFLENVVEGSTAVGSAPREARVNLPYVLEHMDRYQRDKAELKASHVEMVKWRVTELALIGTVKERLEQEKDPLIRTFLKKGIAQSDLDVHRKSQEWQDKLIRTEKEMFQQNLQRIMDEIARCAKEHKFHVVRRMPDPREKRTGAVAPPPMVSSIGSSETWGISPGCFYFSAAPAPIDALPQSSLGSTPVFGYPTVARPDVSLSYPPEILYVAEVRGALSPDISDEIVKRLNAADAATDKASSATRK